MYIMKRGMITLLNLCHIGRTYECQNVFQGSVSQSLLQHRSCGISELHIIENRLALTGVGLLADNSGKDVEECIYSVYCFQ